MVGWKELSDAAGCPAEATEEELGLPLQYGHEPEEYGVMESDTARQQLDTLLENIDMAVKCIKERAAMELRASKKAVEEGECTFTLMCLHEHLGLLFALDILIDRGVWHDQEAS